MPEKETRYCPCCRGDMPFSKISSEVETWECDECGYTIHVIGNTKDKSDLRREQKGYMD